MSEKKNVVVARPGYQVLLNVGSDCLTIDAFSPVDLDELYDEVTLRNCGSLQRHLKEGNLIPYNGEDLPEDPNATKVDALRNASAQHLNVQFAQNPRNQQHPNMQLETKAEISQSDDGKTLNDRVAENRRKIEADDNKLRAKIQTDSENSEKTITTDPTVPSAGMSKKQLSLKVAMDVDPNTFAEKQKAAREKLEAEERAAEDTAQAEIDSLESGE